MEFKSYLNQAWNDHATQATKVAAEFSSGLKLVETHEQLNQLVGLIAHVMGEHLAKWNEGAALLESLNNHTALQKNSETEKSILRSIASLQIGANKNPELSSFSPSDQIRILAVAASALAEKETSRAQQLFEQSLDLAIAIDAKDPANRALAVTGNNLACALEEKTSRSEAETDLMILAAQTARKYWQLAGGALEVSRAEYRLAMTYLQAKNETQALKHAQLCLEIGREHNVGDFDLFYAYEALALVEKARKNPVGYEAALQQARSYFDKLSDEDKSWCEASLKKI